MTDVPDALVEGGAQAIRDDGKWDLHEASRRRIARAVLAAVWPDLAEEKRRAIDAALIFAAAHDDDARPAVDRRRAYEIVYRKTVEQWVTGSDIRDALEINHDPRPVVDALLASGAVQDAADVRRAVAEPLLALADEWEAEADDDERWLNGPRVAVSEAQEYPATIQVRRTCARQVREALGPREAGGPR